MELKDIEDSRDFKDTLNIRNTEDIRQMKADMEKGTDARTMSAEILQNCGNFWIVEDFYS